jgi:hypothetical protein
VDELKSELQRQAAAQANLTSRTSRLMTANIVLALLLAVAVCAGAVSFGLPLINQARGAVLAQATATEPSPLRSTVEPNNAAVEPTAPTEIPPTVAPTDAPPGASGLDCGTGQTFSGYYDCTITNPGADPDSLSLLVQAEGGQANGFSPSVTVDNQATLLPDARTNLVPLGDFQPAEEKTVRLVMSCMAATGCPATTFVLSLWTDRGTQKAPGSELRLTAEYPTAGQ